MVKINIKGSAFHYLKHDTSGLQCIGKGVNNDMAKQGIAIYLKNEIENSFKSIKRRFKSLKELNMNFQAQRAWIFQNLTNRASYLKRLVKVLEVIKMHSCKHLGISYLTENHICDMFESQFKESISKRSVATYLKHLKDIGFLSTVATKRQDGKQSANILILEPIHIVEAASEAKDPTCVDSGHDIKFTRETKVEDEENAGCEPAYKEPENLHTNKTKSSLKTKLKDLRERKARPSRNNKRLQNIPEWFKEKLSCFTTEPSKVSEYWKITKLLTQKRHGFKGDACEEVGTLGIKEFFKAMKASSKGAFSVRNPFGFFYSVLSTEIGGYQRRNAHAALPALYNWLDAN